MDRRKPGELAPILEKIHAEALSGGNIPELCKQNSVNSSQYYKWRRANKNGTSKKASMKRRPYKKRSLPELHTISVTASVNPVLLSALESSIRYQLSILEQLKG